VESPVRRESHAGFGGRVRETDLGQPRHRARARPNTNGTLMLHRRLVREYEIRPTSSVSRTWWAATANLVRRLTDTATATWRHG